MNRLMAMAAVTLAGALAFTACSGPGGASSGPASNGSASSAKPTAEDTSPVTIRFMEAMSSGAQKEALAKMTKDFQAKYPYITVQLEEQPNYGALQTKINAEVAANHAPTIAQVYGNWADELATAKVIDNLDDKIKDNPQYKGFYQGIKDDLKLADGKTWMWPFNKSVVVQYYNTTMVKDAPKTWDDFAKTAKDVSKDKVVALSIDPGNATSPAGGTALFEILAEANGDPVFAADGTPQFDKPGAQAALKYLVDLKKANALALGTNYPGQTALGNQSGAFDVSSVASYPFNMKAVGGKFPLGVAPLPAGPKSTANQLAGTNIAMFAKASPQEKAAAWKYLQWLTSDEQMAYWAVQSGYLPVSPSVFDQPSMKDYVGKNPWVKDVAAQLDKSKSLPPKAWVNKASGALSVAIQEAVDGKSSPEDALKKAQDAGMKAMKEGR